MISDKLLSRYGVTNEHTNIRTDERKDEKYIPLGINAGGIITNGTIGRTPNGATTVSGSVRGSPNGTIGNFTNGIIGSQWYHWLTNGTIGLPLAPFVPLGEPMVSLLKP